MSTDPNLMSLSGSFFEEYRDRPVIQNVHNRLSMSKHTKQFFSNYVQIKILIKIRTRKDVSKPTENE